MSFEITTAFVETYKSNVYHLAQQEDCRFAGKLRTESQAGKTAFYEQLGATTAVKRTSRHGDTPRVDSDHQRRACFLEDYDWSDLVDTLDQTKLLINPTSSYAKSAANAFNRAKDEVIIAAATGTAYTGENGTTAVALPSAQQIAVNYVASGSPANSGLTLAKMIEAKSILGKAEYMKGAKLYLAHTQQQLDDLLNNVDEVNNADYNNIKALVSGEVNTFMGFEFIKVELLSLDSATDYRTCFAYVDYSLLLAVGQDMKTRITERDDKNYATQVYMNMQVGATRLEEALMVDIQCDESV